MQRTAVRTLLRTAATARLPLRTHHCAVRTYLPRAACCCLHRVESFARSTTQPVLLLRCAHAAALPQCRGAVRMLPHRHRAHRHCPAVPPAPAHAYRPSAVAELP